MVYYVQQSLLVSKPLRYSLTRSSSLHRFESSVVILVAVLFKSRTIQESMPSVYLFIYYSLLVWGPHPAILRAYS